jgi:predicted glycosyltransferase
MKYESFSDYGDEKFLSELSIKSFNEIVEKYEMYPNYDIFREDGKIMVNEVWKSDVQPAITATRIYEFDVFFVELIPIGIRNDLLNEVLQICVDDEKYEVAAEIRDVLLTL